MNKLCIHIDPMYICAAIKVCEYAMRNQATFNFAGWIDNNECGD